MRPRGRCVAVALGMTMVVVAWLVSVRGASASDAAARREARVQLVPSATTGPPPLLTWVDTGEVAVAAGSQAHASVDCPAGTVPLGGGVDADQGFTSRDLNLAINSSYPTATGWAGDVNNTNSSDAVFDVGTFCAKQNAAWSIQQSASQPNPAGFQTRTTVQCPAGTKVLGGGAYSSTTSVAVNLNSTFPVKTGTGSTATYSWSTDMNNADTADHSVTGYAVCGKERGYHIYHGGVGPVNAYSEGGTSVACSQNPKVPIGGGMRSGSGSTTANLNTSTWDGAFSWQGLLENNSAFSSTFQGFVICAGT
jgi:hypothetical protein